MTSAGPGCSRPPHCAQDPSPAPASPQQELQGGQRPKLSLLSPSRTEGALPASAPRGRGPSAALALQSPGPMKAPVPVAPGTFLNQLFSQCPEGPSQGRDSLYSSAQEGVQCKKSKIYPVCFGVLLIALTLGALLQQGDIFSPHLGGASPETGWN